jgi:3,5-epimerase/4-reductase
MKVLVFGAKGWIGQQFLNNTTHEVVVAKTRPENYEECFAEIKESGALAVLSFLGRTHGVAPDGTKVGSVDYLELPGKLAENIRDNLYAPYNLANICETLNLHFIYLGTGCIYTYEPDKKTFTEEDIPNFSGSGYSTVKGYTDQILRRFNNTLQLRIRMPISRLVSNRNFIDKILCYPNICSIANSMTVLDDMWVIIDRMITLRTVGTYNLINPGTIEHSWILNEYKKLIDPSHTWNEISYDEQMKYIKSHRSNNEMTTEKLERFCKENDIELLNIKDSVRRCIEYRYFNKVD